MPTSSNSKALKNRRTTRQQSRRFSNLQLLCALSTRRSKAPNWYQSKAPGRRAQRHQSCSKRRCKSMAIDGEKGSNEHQRYSESQLRKSKLNPAFRSQRYSDLTSLRYTSAQSSNDFVLPQNEVTVLTSKGQDLDEAYSVGRKNQIGAELSWLRSNQLNVFRCYSTKDVSEQRMLSEYRTKTSADQFKAEWILISLKTRSEKQLNVQRPDRQTS
ncbi:hypothetical protein F511_35522 [Dorcoceras hygrometricum]|uniref:Uncharacterized protein n=1 Tax=Dorcoceras hygrometricum TaxID=472368 RepID=A0A2Z7CXB6_9LAMI|nr:hypothetical protein F511_35522 [Dorcoceras hygrometricum]